MPIRKHDDGLQEAVAEITAALSAKVHRKETGETEDLGVICRQIVSNYFLTVLMHSMVNDGSCAANQLLLKSFCNHEWGSDTTAEAATQYKCITNVGTTYAAEYAALDIGTQVYGATSYTTVATLTATGSYTISEHCVHPSTSNAPVASDGIDRSKFTGIALGSGDSITFTYVLSVTGS